MATEKVCSWCKAAPRKVGGYCEGCAKAYRRARHYFKTGGWRPKKVLRGVDAAMYERLFKHKEGREAEKPTK